MGTENILVALRETGARIVSRNLEDIGKSAEKSERGVNALKTALATVAAALATQKLVQYADAWERVAGFTRVATKTTAEAVAVQEELFQIAQKTRQPIAQLTELYSRMARAQRTLGASQRDVLGVTELVGKALVVQGASGEATNKVLIQLGQALGGGIVRGEEYNAMAENLPYALAEVAKHIKGVDGNVSALRAKMLAGTLSSKEFFDALKAAGPEIEEAFKKAPTLFGQGMAIIENAMIKFFGTLNQTLGLSKKFVEAAYFLSDNMTKIAAAAVAAGVAIATAFTPLVITKFAAALNALWLIVAAHPFLIITAAIVGLITYIAIAKDDITAFKDETTKLGDVWTVIKRDMTDYFDELADKLQQSADAHRDSTDIIGNIWSKLYDGVMKTNLFDFILTTAKEFDKLAGILAGVSKLVYREFSAMVILIGNAFKETYNVIIGVVADIVTHVGQGINYLREKAGKEPLELLDLNKFKADITTFDFKGTAEGIGNAFKDGFKAAGSPAEDYIKGLKDKAFIVAQAREGLAEANRQEVARALANKVKADAVVDPKAAAAAAAAKEKEARETRRAETAYRDLLNTIYPIDGAMLNMKKAQETLDEARRRGLPGIEKYDLYLELAKEHYQDSIDPIAAVNREMLKSAETLRMDDYQRETHIRYLEIEEQLKKAGIKLSADEHASARDRIKTQIESDAAFADKKGFTDYIKNLNDEIDLLKFSGKELEFETEKQKLNNQIKGDANKLTETEVALLKEKLALKRQDALIAEMKRGGSEQQIADFKEKSGAASKAGLTATDKMGQFGDLLKGTDVENQAKVDSFQAMRDKIAIMERDGVITAKTASQARIQIYAQEVSATTQKASQFFGEIAQLQNSKNKQMAKVGKAAAITQAVINTYNSATGAFAAMSSIPYVGPALGAAAAAAAIAVGMQNVAAIKNQNTEGYMTGGGFTVGGSGGADSQQVAFRATPGERVSISTPTQQRKGDPNADGKGGQSVQVPVKIVNVIDPAMMTAAMSSAAGEKVILNTIEQNPSVVRKLLG